jgi:hypothetical protein
MILARAESVEDLLSTVPEGFCVTVGAMMGREVVVKKVKPVHSDKSRPVTPELLRFIRSIPEERLEQIR